MKPQSRSLPSTLPLLSLLLAGTVGAQTLPRGPNLLVTPTISSCYSTFSCTGSSNGWTLSGATPDTPHKYAGNSVKLSSVGSELVSNVHWPVTPGQTYTFSVFMKTDGNMPQALPWIRVQTYNSSGIQVRERAVSERMSVSDVGGGWQEVVVAFQPKSGEATVGIRITMEAQASEATTPATVWVSDAYMGDDVVFDQPASTKSAFDGSLVKVDERGNFQIKQSGDWAPFFPICIYAIDARDDWSVYKTLGFNCNMWAGSEGVVRKSTAAGLLSGYSITQFIVPGNTFHNRTDLLGADIDRLAARGALPDVRDSVLFYYWDNENTELTEWSVPKAVAKTIDTKDRDANGDRMHPVFSLQGQEALARKYNPDGLVSGTVDGNGVVRSMSDTVGTYVSQEAYNGSAAYTQTFGQTILQNIEQQRQPVSIAIFNGDPNGSNYAGAQFRAAVYTAVAHGATGIGYWRDCVSDCEALYSPPQLESTAWWTDLAGLAAVIQSQLPVIQAPVPTAWYLTKIPSTPPTPADNVQWGLRMLDDEGYVIAGNENASDATPQFSIGGSLGYASTSVIDAYTRDWMSDVSSGTFSLPLAANNGGIYLLGSNVPDTLALKLAFTGNLDDASKAGNSGGVLSSSGATISGNALALNTGDVKIPAHPSLEMNGNLTIVARVDISTSQTGYATIVDKGATTPTTAGYFFFYDPVTSQLRFWYGAGTSGVRNYLNATVPSLLGNWHTVAVSAKLDGTVTFYVDGQDYAGSGFVRTEYRNTMANPDVQLQIGAAGVGNYLKGSIDDLRIFKAALTKSEINAL